MYHLLFALISKSPKHAHGGNHVAVGKGPEELHPEGCGRIGRQKIEDYVSAIDAPCPNAPARTIPLPLRGESGDQESHDRGRRDTVGGLAMKELQIAWRNGSMPSLIGQAWGSWTAHRSTSTHSISAAICQLRRRKTSWALESNRQSALWKLL